MAGKLFGVIYLTPIQIKLSIIDLKTLRSIENANVSFFQPTEDKYPQNASLISDKLKGFQRLLKDYGVKNYRLWGNQQSLDDISARYLAEQIFVRNNLRVHWLNTSQLTYYKAIGIITHLDKFKQFERKQTFLLSLGSEKVSLSQFKEHKFISTWNIDLGSAHLDDLSSIVELSPSDPIEVIDDFIGSKLENLRHNLAAERPAANLILQDARALSHKFIQPQTEIQILQLAKFNELYEMVLHSSEQFLIDYFDIEEHTVNRLKPYFILIKKMLELLNIKQIIISSLTVSDGLAIEQAQKNHLIKQDLNEIIITSAENMANRYLTSHSHRQIVTELALHLFDRLKQIHHLGKRERLLLQIAATVDDVGNYISQQGHYRHSAYILEANKIIGLSDEENQLIAEVSRYHSSESPEINEPHFQRLDPKVQMKVAKLAAILRLADALDDSREEKIQKISVSLRKDQLIIYAYATQNITLEKWSFKNKSSLFTEVYGIQPILKQRRRLK
jgi:exopolyphosphatase/guanosine-5'-triphosphate,3'-diphosphate pyrophosphatase